MTKKDYIALAAALRAQRPEDVELTAYDTMTQWQTDIRAVAHVLARDNPAFAMARFLKACGLEGE